LNGVSRPPFQALEQRRVLAVDRKQQAAAAPVRRDRKLAGSDKALLVCERQRDTTLECPERRVHACESDNRIQHDVRLRDVEELVGAATNLHVLDPMCGCHRCERLCSRHKGTQLEVEALLDDLDGLATD
jgi:hypothetical protein